MLAKTHLAIGIFAALLVVDKVANTLVFIPVVLIASLLPDIDTHVSTLGRGLIFRPLQWLTRHRGILHSFTIACAVALFFAFYIPVLAFPFFLGYGLHLLVDSFTVEGIQPFWPLRNKSEGKLRVGGSIEHAIFIAFCITDVALFISFIL